MMARSMASTNEHIFGLFLVDNRQLILLKKMNQIHQFCLLYTIDIFILSSVYFGFFDFFLENRWGKGKKKALPPAVLSKRSRPRGVEITLTNNLG
jgi:hypothetical protein